MNIVNLEFLLTNQENNKHLFYFDNKKLYVDQMYLIKLFFQICSSLIIEKIFYLLKLVSS